MRTIYKEPCTSVTNCSVVASGGFREGARGAAPPPYFWTTPPPLILESGWPSLFPPPFPRPPPPPSLVWKSGSATGCHSKTCTGPRVPCEQKTDLCKFWSVQKFVHTHANRILESLGRSPYLISGLCCGVEIFLWENSSLKGVWAHDEMLLTVLYCRRARGSKVELTWFY